MLKKGDKEDEREWKQEQRKKRKIGVFLLNLYHP
jgi:hypothetical protein